VVQGSQEEVMRAVTHISTSFRILRAVNACEAGLKKGPMVLQKKAQLKQSGSFHS